MRSSYRFPTGNPECDPTWRMVGVRQADERPEDGPDGGGREGVEARGRNARRPPPGCQAAGGYASTTSTSSSVISPSTMRYERNWKSPASSASAVQTRT